MHDWLLFRPPIAKASARISTVRAPQRKPSAVDPFRLCLEAVDPKAERAKSGARSMAGSCQEYHWKPFGYKVVPHSCNLVQ